MADVTGTAGNDILFFDGDLGQLTTTIVNAYSGQSLLIDDEYNINTASYEGLAGIDTLFMTNFGDALFITNNVGAQMLSNIERIIAGDGGDLIVLSHDTITLGNLFIDGGRGNDILWGNVGADTIRGFDGDDILDGGPGNDIMQGQNDNDILQGGDGNDTLNGGTGLDVLHGGTGSDLLQFTADMSFSPGAVAVNDGSPGINGTGEIKTVAGMNGSLDVFDGGDGYDTLTLTSGGDAFFLYDDASGAGFRLIDVEQINAGAGDDVINLSHSVYSYGDIKVFGEAGNDTIWSSSGNDLLDGGNGDDNLNGGIGNDTLNGGAGNDVLVGGPGLAGNPGLVIVNQFAHDFADVLAFPVLVAAHQEQHEDDHDDDHDDDHGNNGNHGNGHGNDHNDDHDDDHGNNGNHGNGHGNDHNDDHDDDHGNNGNHGNGHGNDHNDDHDDDHGNNGNNGNNGNGHGNDHNDDHDDDHGNNGNHSNDHDDDDTGNALSGYMGIMPGDLSVNYQTTATISFVSADATLKSSLGAYTVGADGTIQHVQMAFANTLGVAAGDSATFNVGGADSQFGLFLIANGFNANDMYGAFDLAHGEMKFIYDLGGAGERLAKVTDSARDMTLVFDNGANVTAVDGHVYHTTARGGANDINFDGESHVVSGLAAAGDSSTLRIGFEDLPNAEGRDFNDLVIDLSLAGYTTQTLTVNDHDVLYGAAGNDILNGGVGNDVLFGGEGADTLTGGQGADTFVFDTMDGFADTVMDFEAGPGGDVLNITNILQGFDVLDDAISYFAQLLNDGGNTELYINADGDVGGMFTAVAIIQGGVGDATLADLINSGNLIVNQAPVL